VVGRPSALPLKASCSENETGAVNLFHRFYLPFAESGSCGFAARIGQEPLARFFLNINYSARRLFVL
jgi:hypothetical protein